MSDDHAMHCRDVDVYTRARMAEKGVSIPAEFLCELRCYDGEVMQILVPSHALLSTFLRTLEPERTLIFRAADETREEFEQLMNRGAVVLH